MAKTNLKILSLARVIGNCALLNSVQKINFDQLLNSSYAPCNTDKLLVQRLKTLAESKLIVVRSVRSRDIYTGICSKQNWYYRVLTGERRLLWILNSLFEQLSRHLLIGALYSKQKNLYTRTKRVNYSEGLRRLRQLELCIFLNFTTKK